MMKKIGKRKYAQGKNDARFKVPPPQRIGRVRLMGEPGEQLILT